MKGSNDVRKLLRLKRYESPGEEYFDSFLDDFKDRQRSELVGHSPCSILAERLTVWFDELGQVRWLVPAGAAAAVIGVGVFVATWVPPETRADSRDMAITPEMPSSDEVSEKFEITLPRLDTEEPSYRPEVQSPNKGINKTPSGLLPANYREL
jgi:hypothetical protein